MRAATARTRIKPPPPADDYSTLSVECPLGACAGTPITESSSQVTGKQLLKVAPMALSAAFSPDGKRVSWF
jgi:hypothetical protein